MKRIVLLVLGNFFVLGFLVFFLNLVAVSANQVNHWLDRAQEDHRADLPNYQGVAWAKTHFREFNELSVEFQSFYGWRRRPFSGQTINIDADGNRRTVAPAGAHPTRSIAFLGGSTMWGSGVDDAHTIPSSFDSMRPEYLAYNWGEMGHTAHQNLNLFFEKLSQGKRPDVVVFYNGVNEVSQCRRELSAFSHTREMQIRALLDGDDTEFHKDASFASLFAPTEALIERLEASFQARFEKPASYYDCDEKPKKAEQIARIMLWDWLAAKRLVESYGGRFVAVLQPVAYFSHTKKDHIKIEKDREAQYRAVYPRIVELLNTEFPMLQEDFLDLREAFDKDEYIYIDFCHVSPNGNQIIASLISQYLRS